MIYLLLCALPVMFLVGYVIGFSRAVRHMLKLAKDTDYGMRVSHIEHPLRRKMK